MSIALLIGLFLAFMAVAYCIYDLFWGEGDGYLYEEDELEITPQQWENYKKGDR